MADAGIVDKFSKAFANREDDVSECLEGAWQRAFCNALLGKGLSYFLASWPLYSADRTKLADI